METKLDALRALAIVTFEKLLMNLHTTTGTSVPRRISRFGRDGGQAVLDELKEQPEKRRTFCLG